MLKDCSDETKREAYKKLMQLFKIVNRDKIINYYLEKENNLDKVLNIFIRMNSMGTKLNNSDLLLSIATDQWKNRDAREEINKLLDELNKEGFAIDKDFILKAALYLTKK